MISAMRAPAWYAWRSAMLPCAVRLPTYSPAACAQGIIAQQQQRISGLEAENGELRAAEREHQQRALALSEKLRHGAAFCPSCIHAPQTHGVPLLHQMA